MFEKSNDRIKGLKYPLRANIAAIFSILMIVLGLIILSISYYTFNELILSTSRDKLKTTTKSVRLKLVNVLHPFSKYSEITEKLNRLGILDFNNKEEMRKYFLGVIKDNPDMYSIYLGSPSGSFFQLKHNLTDPNFFIEEDFDREGEVPIRHQRLIDFDGNIADESVVDEMSYDPRIRTWYIKAIEKKIPIWSSLYRFALKQTKVLHGVTTALPIYRDGVLNSVLGVDVTIDNLISFMQQQKIFESSTLYLIGEEGKVLSTKETFKGDGMGVDELKIIDDPRLLTSFNNYIKTKNPVFLFSLGDIEYLAAYTPVEELEDARWTIAHIVEYSEILGPLRRFVMISLLVMIGFSLVGVLIAIVLAGKISKPIKQIALMAEKMGRLELKKHSLPESRVKEIYNMSCSFETMRVALESFTKYMPINLVKKLMAQQAVAQPGGDNKVLTILFSDLTNFTGVSEGMPPGDLMKYLSGYLECMTGTIHLNDGTVDKYIGDGVMAFWGAPIENKDHAVNACRCALSMQKELEIYNRKLNKQQKPEIIMRIGIHTGEVTVGNIGSSDRLSYTVIGDNVNLASRFESLNKMYKTNIIVSQNVCEAVTESFHFRLLDFVQVKGKTVGIKIYELMPEELFDEDYHTEFLSSFNLYASGDWNTAEKGFRKLLTRFPGDRLVELYVGRCQNFKQNPPLDWKGVWVSEQK